MGSRGLVWPNSRSRWMPRTRPSRLRSGAITRGHYLSSFLAVASSISLPSHRTATRLLRFVSTTGTYSNMLKSNRLKQVFAEARRPAMGFWQMLPGANVSRVLARSGADWVMVDCEHGNIDGRESACIRPSSGVLHPTLGQRTLLMMASQMLPCTRQFPLLPLWVFPQLFEYQTSSHGW